MEKDSLCSRSPDQSTVESIQGIASLSLKTNLTQLPIKNPVTPTSFSTAQTGWRGKRHSDGCPVRCRHEQAEYLEELEGGGSDGQSKGGSRTCHLTPKPKLDIILGGVVVLSGDRELACGGEEEESRYR
eukprot:scaffold3893_cov89-Skeletonema_dohrnii-CCMP3373.AAC.7